MDEMTYERCEIRGWCWVKRESDGKVILPSICLSPDEQRRMAVWLLLDPPPELVKVGDTVRWRHSEYKWEVIGLRNESAWLSRTSRDLEACRSADLNEVEVIR